MKRLTVRLPDEMHELLRVMSFEKKVSLNSLLLNAITRYLLLKPIEGD